MAVLINEMRQRHIEARLRASELRTEEERSKRLGSVFSKAQEEALTAAIELEDATLREVRAEEKARAEEGASLEVRARQTGYNTLGERYVPPGATGEDLQATSALPPLPSRTRAAIARLYPSASSDPEQRAQAWLGVVAAALGGGPMHPAVMAATGTEGVPADGGFAVTPDVAAGIFVAAFESSVWARIGARVETMMSDEKVVNAVDDSDETDDAEATLKADWKEEASEASAQLMKLRRVTLKARKLIVLAAASNELGDDAPDYVRTLEGAVARAIGKKFDKAVLTGTGAGMPLGLLNAPATITATKETGQAADTFLWQNATKMWSKLAPGSHENAWWLIHPTVLPQGLSMSLPIGTGGTQPRGAFEAGGPTGYMLLGRPVLVTSRVKVLGDKGDVILVDPSQIAIGIRRGLAVERSAHAFFSSDRLAIRGKFRGDARPLWNEARTLVDSGGTVSPIVVLEAR